MPWQFVAVDDERQQIKSAPLFFPILDPFPPNSLRLISPCTCAFRQLPLCLVRVSFEHQRVFRLGRSYLVCCTAFYAFFPLRRTLTVWRAVRISIPLRVFSLSLSSFFFLRALTVSFNISCCSFFFFSSSFISLRCYRRVSTIYVRVVLWACYPSWTSEARAGKKYHVLPLSATSPISKVNCNQALRLSLLFTLTRLSSSFHRLAW